MQLGYDDATGSKNALCDQAGQVRLLRRVASTGVSLDLAWIFDRAVTDFRTVKRNARHQKILEWCVDQGVDFNARQGWFRQSLVSLAAGFGNNKIVAYMMREELPADPFMRASVGDVEFIRSCAAQQDLASLADENGFNLLFYCAQSGLGRHDEAARERLADLCRLLLDHGVNPQHEVLNELPITPAYLCASYGGNAEIMRMLLDRGGVSGESFHVALQHSLEPHQRSGEPYYHIADLILQHGFDINEIDPEHGRTELHGASNRGTVKAVRWYLANGADPNALDEHGCTPLHVAAERNTYTTVVKLLIESSAELNKEDQSGKTALDYARENQRDKVVAYLTSLGGC